MIDINHLCQNCLNEADMSEAICAFCGQDPNQVPNRSSRCLPQYTILAGRYLIGRVLGEGGFGITYLAMDLMQEKRIAVKEYFPVDLALRDTKNSQNNEISIRQGEAEIHFRNGMRRFETEALTLRKLEMMPGIVSVLDFFTENNTAYLVMEYIEGGNLKNYLKNYTEKNGHAIPCEQAFSMVKPVLNSLQKVHEAGIIHRDISPENILLDENNELVLIDFGSAKTNLASRENRSMTVMVKHGYAPEEQYRTHGDQGPWTDIYAVCATLYHIVSGILPEDAIERLIGDRMKSLKELDLSPAVPEVYSDIIEKGMQIRGKNRYQSIEEMLSDVDAAEQTIAEERRKAEEERRKAEEAKRKAEEERRKAEEAERKAEEERRKAEEAKRKAEEERRKAEEERRKAEEAARREAECKAAEEKAKQEASLPESRQAKQVSASGNTSGGNRHSGKKKAFIFLGILIAALAIILLGPVRSAHFHHEKFEDGQAEAKNVTGSERDLDGVEESVLEEVVSSDLLEKLEEFDLNPVGWSEVDIMSVLAEQYLNSGQELRAAIMYGRIGEIPGYEDYLVKSLELWQLCGFCNDIDYRTQRIAAINSDGTVRALRSPSAAVGFSEVSTWSNIVSVVFAKMGGDLYGLRADGTIVCNGFNCKEFGRLTDVIGLTSVTNGYTAALLADGTVCFDNEIDGKMYVIEDPAWYNIRYISGGYASLIGIREDGVVLEAYLPFEGTNKYTVTETAEINYADGTESAEKPVKAVADGGILLVLKADGTIDVEKNPIDQYGTSDSFWLSDDDVERMRSLNDVIDIRIGSYNAVCLHSDGSVDAFGNLLYQGVDRWEEVCSISVDDLSAFAILSDGTVEYYDSELSENDLAASYLERFCENYGLWDEWNKLKEDLTPKEIMEELGIDNQEVLDMDLEIGGHVLSDTGLTDAVNWTGLRTRSLEAIRQFMIFMYV